MTNNKSAATDDATGAPATNTTNTTVIITTDDGKTKTYKIVHATDDKERVQTILADNIIRNRRRFKMSRAQLAKKIGITEAAIGQYERSIRTPQLDLLCKLADVFNVTVDALIGRDNSTCDLVMDFRFNHAKQMVQMCGFIVDENHDGAITVGINSEKRRLSFSKDDDGIISVDPVTFTTYETLVTFKDRRTFTLYVEDILFGFFYMAQGDGGLSLKGCFESVFTTHGRSSDLDTQKPNGAVMPKIRKKLKKILNNKTD